MVGMDVDEPSVPSGLVENADAFAALKARAEMSEISDHRAARAAAADGGVSDLQVIRIFAAMLRKAAIVVGVPYDDYGYDLPRLAEAIVTASQRGAKLPPADYRVVYGIWDLFRRHAAPPHDETAASA